MARSSDLDSSPAVVAFCSYPVATCSQPNLWFVDAGAPVSLPDQYPWPDHLLGSYGSYLLAHRPRGRDLGLIDESGRLAVQLRCPRAITSICVAEGALLIAAGALICLEIDGLSPLMRTRVWRPPFTAAAPPSPQSRERPAGRRERLPVHRRGHPLAGKVLEHDGPVRADANLAVNSLGPSAVDQPPASVGV